MLINNIWRCTTQAFSDGIWAKGPLDPKYQFYQNTYCLSKDIGNRSPLRFIIFNEQIRSRFLDMKSFITQGKWRSHLKGKITCSKFSFSYWEFCMMVCFPLCFYSSYLLWPKWVKKTERPKENPHLLFDNNDSKASLHLNIKRNINLT